MWTFVVWFFVFDGAIMSAITVSIRRGDTFRSVRQELKPGLLAGLASLITYSTALIALRLIPTGSAAALRETGVVFGVLLAGIFLKERITNRRALGATLVAIGGAAIAFWR